MPLTRLVADALGVVTISLVAVLCLLGLLCIFYSFYFRGHIRSQGYTQLGYFSGPWVVRILLILLAIFWGFGEILRLEFLRLENRVLHALSPKWQETLCKCYIVSNLGFSEPCLFLTLVFLLRASLQKTQSGTLSKKWNFKTVVYILLCCSPLLALQATVVLLGPQSNKRPKRAYLFKVANSHDDVTLCSYPLLSIVFLGFFATVLTVYLFWLGRRILKLVINKGLRKRVYALIFSVSSFFLLRVVFLGLSVLSKPGNPTFEILSFLAFLSLLSCSIVGICMLVYFPIADSLALRDLQRSDTLSLVAELGPLDDVMGSSGSTKRGSISFRAERGECSGVGGYGAGFVELSAFSPSSPMVSPGRGWPMVGG